MISIKYTKLSNQFFFISTLASWHYSCRKNYKEIWLKNEPLNELERKVLEDIKIILQKYGFGRKYLGLAFFQDKKQWEYLSKLITKEEYKTVQNVFCLFQKRFEKEWQKEEKKLKKWQDILKNHKIIKSKEIVMEIKKILNSKLNPKIQVYLLLNPDKNKNPKGGANEGKDKVNLELSCKTQNDLPFVLSVLFHEITHIYQRDYTNSLIKRYLKNNDIETEYQKIRPDLYQQKFGIFSLYKETIANALFNNYWQGVLTVKYLQSKKRSYSKPIINPSLKTIDDLLGYSIKITKPKIEEYIVNNKKFDNELLGHIWENFKQANLQNIKN